MLVYFFVDGALIAFHSLEIILYGRYILYFVSSMLGR